MCFDEVVHPPSKPSTIARTEVDCEGQGETSTITLWSLEEHPERLGEFLEFDELWPPFMLQDPLGLLLTKVGALVASSMYVIVDESSDTVLGRAVSIPVHWSIDDALPKRGWDAAIEAGIECITMGLTPRCLCALEITLGLSSRGSGLSRRVLELLRQSAIDRSFEGLVAPVRPTKKAFHLNMAMSDYLSARTDGGFLVDPWLRVHQELGAEVDSTADISMTIAATFDEWAEWTGTDPGTIEAPEMAVEGGLAPVLLDHHNRTGTYVEPNVWCKHRLADFAGLAAASDAEIDLRDTDSVPVPPQIPEGWQVAVAEDRLVHEAEQLEYRTFMAAGYCEPSETSRVVEFEPWRDASEFVTVLSPDGHVQGAVRMVVGDFGDLPAASFERYESFPPDPLLEYASLSVSPECRKSGVAEWLFRAVWQQMLRHGAAGMVAIGEQWLLETLNEVHGLGFQQLGPSRWYMGGDCFIMGTDTTSLIARLKRQPSFFRWATTEIDLRDLPRPDVRSAIAELRRS